MVCGTTQTVYGGDMFLFNVIYTYILQEFKQTQLWTQLFYDFGNG